MNDREKMLRALYYELLPGESGADPADVKESAFWAGFGAAVELVEGMLEAEA